MGVINIITLLLAGWGAGGWIFGSRFVLHYRELSTFASILTLDSQWAFYRMIDASFRSSFSPLLSGLHSFFRPSLRLCFQPHTGILFIVFFIKSTRVTLRIKWQLYLLLKNNLTVWFKTMNAHASIMKSQWVRIQRGKVIAPTTSLCSYFIENFAKFLSRIDKTKPCSSAI